MQRLGRFGLGGRRLDSRQGELLASRQLLARVPALLLGYLGADPRGVSLGCQPLERGQPLAELGRGRLDEAEGCPAVRVGAVDCPQPVTGCRLGLVGRARRRARRPVRRVELALHRSDDTGVRRLAGLVNLLVQVIDRPPGVAHGIRRRTPSLARRSRLHAALIGCGPGRIAWACRQGVADRIRCGRRRCRRGWLAGLIRAGLPGAGNREPHGGRGQGGLHLVGRGSGPDKPLRRRPSEIHDGSRLRPCRLCCERRSVRSGHRHRGRDRRCRHGVAPGVAAHHG